MHESRSDRDTHGCTWRTNAVMKVINASCMQSRLFRNVESRNLPCYAQCPGAAPAPALPNRSTSCVVGCFQNSSLLMTARELIAPWTAAFASNDASKGGCPTCVADAHGVYTCPEMYMYIISSFTFTSLAATYSWYLVPLVTGLAPSAVALEPVLLIECGAARWPRLIHIDVRDAKLRLCRQRDRCNEFCIPCPRIRRHKK